MKARIFFVLSLLMLTLFSVASAQNGGPAPAPMISPDPQIHRPLDLTRGNDPLNAPKKSYADSAEFVKAFKEFYPTIKPKQSVKEMAEQALARTSRSFKVQGLDSVEASVVAMHGLDTNASEKIYFNLYRENLSAKELKAYIAFLKSPEGKHVMEVLPALQRAQMESTQYPQRTIMSNLRPLMQAANEKRMKENPPEGITDPRAMHRTVPPLVIRMPPRDSLAPALIGK